LQQFRRESTVAESGSVPYQKNTDHFFGAAAEKDHAACAMLRSIVGISVKGAHAGKRIRKVMPRPDALSISSVPWWLLICRRPWPGPGQSRHRRPDRDGSRSRDCIQRVENQIRQDLAELGADPRRCRIILEIGLETNGASMSRLVHRGRARAIDWVTISRSSGSNKSAAPRGR